MLRVLKKHADRGDLLTVGRDDRTEVLHFPQNLPENAKPHAKAITDILDGLGEKATAWNSDFTPLGLTTQLRNSCALLQTDYNALIAAGISAVQAENRIDNDFAAPGEPTPLDHLIVNHALSLNFSERLQWLQQASKSQLAAVLRVGPEIILPESRDPAVWKNTVFDRYFEMNAVDHFQARHAGKPTLDDPLAAASPDRESAQADAAKFLDDRRNRIEAIGNLKQLIQRIAVAVAVICEVTPDHAFKALQGKTPL